MSVSRSIGAIGLIAILIYVRFSLVPLIAAAAFCGALIAARARLMRPGLDHQK